MNFSVSTVAFNWATIEEMTLLARNAKLRLEFASGLPYRADMEKIFYEASPSPLIHNYFPPPEQPFVINLASASKSVRGKSLDHGKKALKMAATVGAPFYSIHAGFCVDPNPEDLGRKFAQDPQWSRAESWGRFVKSVRVLVHEARRLHVSILIENNVTTSLNVSPDGTALLLCVSDDEIVQLFSEINDDTLGLLLDTGHLKVSAQTLGFSKGVFMERVGRYVKGIHHSDNDGRNDTNHPLGNQYWFLPYMKKHKNTFHILEVRNQSVSQIMEQFRLIEKTAGAIA